MIWLLQAAAPAGGDAADTQVAADAARDEGLLVHMLPYIVLGLSVMFFTHFLRYNPGTLAHYFLGNVVYWTLPGKEEEGETDSNTAAAAAAASAASVSSSATGNKKKLRKLQQQQQMGGIQQAYAALKPAYLRPQLLYHLEFTEDFDYMLKAFMVLLMNLVAAVVIRTCMTPTFPTNATNILVTVWGFLFYTLYKVEWAHLIIGRDEKLYMSAAATLGAVVAVALLLWAPASALAFDPAAATEEATSRMAALVRSRFKNLPAGELQPVKEGGPLGAMLALVGGALAGLLMAPGIRYGRLLQSLLEPPVWAFNFQPSMPAKLLAQAGFALQLLLTPLWVTGATDVLRLPAIALPWIRGVLMLVVALIQACTVPYLLQAFLYSTPLHAHVITRNPIVSDDMKAKSVKRVTQVTLSQASKVCLQLLFVPALMLSSAMACLLTSYVSPLAATSRFASPWDKQPSQMMWCVAGFIGWWSSTVFMFWASLGGLLSRLHSAALGN